MTFINEMVSEGNLLNDLLKIFEAVGWEKERYFKRTAFDKTMASPSPGPQDISSYKVGIAEHLILKHPSEKLFYGFAVYGDLSLDYSSIPADVRPLKNVYKSESTEIKATDYRSSDNFKAFADWVTNKWPPFKQKHTLYVYMTEKVHVEFEENLDTCLPWGGDLKRAALDIDVIEAGHRQTKALPQLHVFEAKQAKRSPIVTMRLRRENLESTSDEYGADNPVISSNFNFDSTIEVKGLIDEEKCMLIFEADTAASFEDNAVPTVPLYMGSFEKLADWDDRNFALFAGAATPSATFDYDSSAKLNSDIMPLLEEYKGKVANGVDDIMVYRTRRGSYYLAHYLYVETVSNEQEPARNYNGRDYPRAWQRAESDVYDYQMNPSMYTDDVASSLVYFASPEEGLRGHFSDIITANPISLQDYDTLLHERESCPSVDDEYTVFITSAVSPLTKVPGTPYHQLALGMLTKLGGQ